jgi:hypothetical protein
MGSAPSTSDTHPSILPVTSGFDAASSLRETAMREAGLELLPWTYPEELETALMASAVANAVLLDASGGRAVSWTVQNTLQAHPAWCVVPTVVFAENLGTSQGASCPKPPIAPEISLAGVPTAEELIVSVREVISGQLPPLQLRRLERSRLRSHLNLSRETSTVDSASANLGRAVREVTVRLAEAEKRMQIMRRAQCRLTDSKIPIPPGIVDWLSSQAVIVESYRQQIHAFEAERRELRLRRYRTSKELQGEIQELDRQIHLLSKVIRFSRALEK